jgi:hypothetical protein
MAVPTYSELAQMARSTDFIDRVAVAVAFYARYIVNEDPGTLNHKRRYDWARTAILNPRAAASAFLETIAIDSIFASQNPLNLSGTPDSGAGSLQAAVEATINATVLQY